MESTALHLETKGDLRTLICFVERWAEVGEPTLPARLAQARALVSLGLMDRAWSRLQDLVESGRGGAEAVAVAARMFLDRGWNKQARHVLQAAIADYPEDEVLQQLWERAAEPPTQPDLTLADKEDAKLEVLLGVAEYQMASGAFVKARSLLERVRREDPDNSRAADLLWALDGDFSLRGSSLGELAEQHGPDLSDLADLADESEHTAEVDSSHGAERDNGDGSSSFPSLFRNMEPRTELYKAPEEPEVTQLSSMAEIDELRRAAVETTESGSDDTQILRVIHRNSTPKPAEEHGETGTFDLAAFRREMGMTYAPNTDYADAPEEEDDDLIVLTRREDTHEITETTTAVAGLELRPEEEALPQGRRGLVDEAAAWVRTETEPVAPAPEKKPRPAPPPAPDEEPEEELAPTGVNWPWGLAVAGVILLLLGGSVAALVLLQVATTLF